MKKILLTFIILSIIKGLLLFIIILTGDFVTFIPILIRYLLFFIFIGLLDWKFLNIIQKELGQLKIIKSIAFSYLSFLAILWITGPLFQIYNSINKIEVDNNLQMPLVGLLIFLTFGLLATLISSITWTRKIKKTAANSKL